MHKNENKITWYFSTFLLVRKSTFYSILKVEIMYHIIQLNRFFANWCQLFLRFIVTFLFLLAWSRIGFGLLGLPWAPLPIAISISGIVIIGIWAAILFNGIFPQKFYNTTRLIGEIVVWLIHVSHLSYENILTDDLNNLQMYKSIFTWNIRNQDYACLQ